MAGEKYFATGYFADNYWDAEYWAPDGSIQGDFWAPNFWDNEFWNLSYWAVNAPGQIGVQNAGQMSLAAFQTVAGSGPVIQATTPTLALAAFATDADLTIEINATTGALTLSVPGTGVATTGYVLGDIALTFSPESTITITYGVVPDLVTRDLQAFHPTTDTENGLDVGVGPRTDLTMTAWVTDASNEVAVQPTPVAMTLQEYDSPAAGIGELIKVDLRQKTLLAPTHTISGIPVATVRQVAEARMSLTALAQRVFGSEQPTIPTPLFFDQYAPTNDTAKTEPSNYLICDRTGFRVRRGGLKEEWDGAMVREESWERRHPQDFVRAVNDDLEGSKRPEQAEVSVWEKYPNGVTADDL